MGHESSTDVDAGFILDIDAIKEVFAQVLSYSVTRSISSEPFCERQRISPFYYSKHISALVGIKRTCDKGHIFAFIHTDFFDDDTGMFIVAESDIPNVNYEDVNKAADRVITSLLNRKKFIAAACQHNVE